MGRDYSVGAVASQFLHNREPGGVHGEHSWQEAFRSALKLPVDEFYGAHDDLIRDLLVSNSSEECHLALPRGTVRGTVERDDGTPVSRAPVIADRLTRGPWSINWTSTLCDADGPSEMDVVIGCYGESGEGGVFSGYRHLFSVDPFRDGCQRFSGENGTLVDRPLAHVFHIAREVD